MNSFFLPCYALSFSFHLDDVDSKQRGKQTRPKLDTAGLPICVVRRRFFLLSFTFCSIFAFLLDVLCSMQYTLHGMVHSISRKRRSRYVLCPAMYTYIHTIICYFFICSLRMKKKPRGDFFAVLLLMSFQSSCCAAAFFHL